MSNLTISIDALPDNKTVLTVKVPVGNLQKTVEKRIRDVAKTARIDGFRRGKVPVSYVRTQYGASIQQEVINDTIRDTIYEAIRAENVRAIGTPTIDEVAIEDEFLVYKATVEVLPVLDVAPLTGSDIVRQTAAVSEADVDVMIDNLQKQRQTFVEKDGELADGDKAIFDFTGTIDGEKFEGGTATDYTLVIGSNQMISGFEEGMLGMKAGDERTIDVTFPDNYQAEHLQGKQAQFLIKLNKIETPKLPELNDEFFAAFGVTEGGLDKLKTEVKKNMEREIKNAARAQIKQATFDALLEKNEFDVPDVLLQSEINRQRDMMMQRFAQQFGSQANFDKEMLPDALFEDQALRAARLGLLLSHIIEKNALTPDAARVDAFIREAAENYEDPEEVIEYYSTDKAQRANIESLVLEDQVVEFLLQDANVTDEAVAYQQLLARAQQAG